MFVDEIPSVFTHDNFRIKYTHNLVTDHLELEELVQGISVVKATNPQHIDDLIAQADDDQNIETFKGLLISVRDANRMVCIQTATWESLIAGEAKRVDFFTVQLPDSYAGWKDVTFMGANARSTELMVLWSHLGLADFTDYAALSTSLSYDTHGNGDRLTLHYLFERWSKDYADSLVDDDDTVLKSVSQTVSKFFSGPYLWQANKGHEQLLNPIGLIPHLPHGLNRPDMMDCHNVALLSALNRDTAAIKFLSDLGLDSETITATLAYQSEYQTAMRCSLRDPTATSPVHIVVPTKGSAEWIAERFPGAAIKHLDTGLSGPKKAGRKSIGAKPLTPAERKARMKARKAGQL